MKTALTIILIAALLLIAGCSETCKDATHLLCGGDHAGGVITLLSGVDLNDSVNRYDLRAAIVIDELLVGPVLSMQHDKDSKNKWGVYAIRGLTKDGIGILGKPYIGFQATLESDQYYFLSGTVHELSPGIEILTEVKTRTYGGQAEDWNVMVGPRFRL